MIKLMKTESISSTPFDPMSWEHDPNLEGDGAFGVALDYGDVQAPPLMGIYSIHQNAWPDGSRCQRKTWAVPKLTASGAREHQPMSIAETLWQALLGFCQHHCHTINYDMRGGHRIRIQSGHHDAKQWHFQGASWEQVTKKAVMMMMPGYWTNIESSNRLSE